MSQRQRKAYRAGRDHGRARGSWVIDGNTTDAYKAHIIRGYDEGDPEVLDLCPSPLSGEWAGESISELSAEFGVDLHDDDRASDFEDGFADGFWEEVLSSARGTITTTVEGKS